jgi:hypothetical protein
MNLSQRTYRSVGTAAVIWGLGFAVAHFYWAAGGEGAIGNDGELTTGASLYIGFIAVLGLLAAAIARALTHPRGKLVATRRLRAIAGAGSIALALGVVVGTGRWIAAGSLGDDGAGGVAITAYFLLGAVLLAALAWGRPRLARLRAGYPQGVEPATPRAP